MYSEWISFRAKSRPQHVAVVVPAGPVRMGAGMATRSGTLLAMVTAGGYSWPLAYWMRGRRGRAHEYVAPGAEEFPAFPTRMGNG
jgi:hypothetical protein